MKAALSGGALAGGADAAPPAKEGEACDLVATSAATLASEFDAAKGGQTICLAAGSYGTFPAGPKPATVTVRSRSGQSASMALAFDKADNVKVDSVTVTGADIGAASRNVTVSHSRFTGLAAIHVGRVANSNILFDHNTHVDIDTCRSCFSGRVHVDPVGQQPSGVTISNSLFDGGNSDGIRADAVGVRLIGNEFRNLRDQDPFHTDPIQIYGGTRIVIRGNYFHDNQVASAIMMADGGSHNIVEDNVIGAGDYAWALTWNSDDGSIISHNTFDDGACASGVRCGIVSIATKPGDPVGQGTIIRDNVLGGVGDGNAHATFTADHNLSRTAIPGTANITGLPTYVGPRDSFAGHRLAPRSLGRRDASDGADRGVRERAGALGIEQMG
jgi:hypothetical protein